MRFAVVGDPIAHSRSPAIHRAALATVGEHGSYEAIRVPVDGFDGVVRDLRSGALDGVNVTMPHKDHAYEAAEIRSVDAERTHAVNTLVMRDGRMEGHNTDVDGVRHALALIGDRSQRVVVLGSGAAARAAIVAVDEGVAVMARSADRAVEALRATAVHGDVVAWGSDVAGATLVNATPLGMHGEDLPEVVLQSAGALVDMAYGNDTTPAVAWATASGLRCADGVDMLVGQAARAFTLFVGRPAPVAVMERAARA